MHIQALFFGFIWGFLLCFTFGPAFFAIVQVSIDSSYKKGIVMTLGVVASDALLMFFAVFGTSFIPHINNFDQIISVVGASLLLFMGLFSIFSKTKQLIYPQTAVGNFVYFFIKGAFLNILNPANFLFVVSTTAYLKGAMKFNVNEIILFFSGSLLATFIAESLISIYAFKVKRLIDPQKINIFNKFAGIFFIFIALRMLWRQFFYFIE